jgi:hypothetical protein
LNNATEGAIIFTSIFWRVIITKTARKITLILTIIAEIICCFGLNLLGGYAFIINGYEKCGYALFISTALLAAALIFAAFRKVIVPFLLNAAGSACYIYTLSILGAIPNTKIPKESTEALMAYHYPTIAVTVLLALIVFFNFMDSDAVQRRNEKRKAKKAAKERALADHEKII